MIQFIQDLLVNLIKDFGSDNLAKFLVIINLLEHLEITFDHSLKDSIE